MKKTLTLIIALVITISTFAQQQGINYKALIKDANGNVLNGFMSVEFTIHEATVAGTIVYQEDETYTLVDGLLIHTIGTVSSTVGVFVDIDWATNIHYLNTKISYSGGSDIDLGTTQFMAVPYAKHALKATHATTSGDTKWVEGTTVNDITNNNTGTIEIAGTLQIQATANIDEFSVDGTFANNSDTAIPTEKAVKTYVDSNLATGLEAIDEGNGIGWRLKGRNTNNYGDIGGNAVDLSYNSTTSTKGATGNYSTAMGWVTTASEFASTAMGEFATASGFASTAKGYNIKAEAYSSTAIGSYNVGGGNPTSWVSTDPLFEIGNSESESSRSNALTIYKNGLTTIHNTTTVIGNLIVAGVVIQNSDRRLKKDIEALSYGLKEILQLQPKAYNWKNRTQEHKSLGLIAQDVQPLIKEIVTAQDDEQKTLGISYTELIPILINAIKEQQEIIKSQQLSVSSLQSTVSNQESKIEVLSSLNKRIQVLEALLITKSEDDKIVGSIQSSVSSKKRIIKCHSDRACKSDEESHK